AARVDEPGAVAAGCGSHDELVPVDDLDRAGVGAEERRRLCGDFAEDGCRLELRAQPASDCGELLREGAGAPLRLAPLAPLACAPASSISSSETDSPRSDATRANVRSTRAWRSRSSNASALRKASEARLAKPASSSASPWSKRRARSRDAATSTPFISPPQLI